jgi:mannose-6-phosphate isomerase-like protein (cupin superfamily)
MKKKKLRFGKVFKMVMGNRRVQAAQMVIAPGDSEGGPKNRHCGSDQCLLGVGGTGTAIVGGLRYALKRHSLLLIEPGERHEIKKHRDIKTRDHQFLFAARLYESWRCTACRQTLTMTVLK